MIIIKMGLLISGSRRGRGGFGPPAAAHIFLLIAGVSWLCSSGVEGVKCYVCSDEGCKTGEMDCPGSEGCATVSGEHGGKKVTGKGCGTPGLKEGCQVTSTGEARMKGCYCKGDLCNGDSSSSGPSSSSMSVGSEGSHGHSSNSTEGSSGHSSSSAKKRLPNSPSLMILLAASTLTLIAATAFVSVTNFGVLRGSI